MKLSVSMFEPDHNFFYNRMPRTLTQTIEDKLTLELILLKIDPSSFAFTKSALLHLLTIFISK